MRASIVFSLAAATLASAQGYGQTNCEDVYNSCIQQYTSQGQSPFFPECNSRRAACEAGSSYSTGPVPTFPAPATTTTVNTYPTSTGYSDACQVVYDNCIAEYTSQGQSPFFPECNSRRAACQAGSSYSTGPVPTFPAPGYTTTVSSYPTATGSGDKCEDVYNQCIAEYTNNGQSPFFPECNSRRAACQAGSSYSTGPVPTFPVPGTTTTVSSYPTSTGAGDKCEDVYNQCIQEYTSQGQSPFFPECNSRRAACQAGSSYSTGLATTTVVAVPPVYSTTAPVASYSPSSTSVRIATYPGAAATQAPVFGLLAAAGALALL